MDIFLFLVGVYCLFINKITLSFVILIGLFTSFYQSGLSTSFDYNLSDLGLLLYLCIYLKGLCNTKRYYYKSLVRIKNLLLFFGCFFILSILFDLIHGSHFLWILKTSRHWFVFFTSIHLITLYPANIYYKVLRYVFYISLVISILILSDYFWGTTFVQVKSSLHLSENGIQYSRGALPTSYAVFYVFLLITDYYKKMCIKAWFKNICLIILFTTIITSIVRSVVISVLLGGFFILYKTKKINFRTIPQILLISLLVVLILGQNEGFIDRFSQGFTEMLNFSESGTKTEVEGNMTFRLALFFERAQYVSEELFRFIFGIGNIPNEVFPQIFQVGLPDKMGGTTQLNTGDIAWAILILRLGYIGLILFSIILIKCVISAYRMKGNLAIIVSTYFFVTFFMLSFSGTTIASGFNFLFIFMLMALTEDQYNLIKENKIS